MPVMATEYSFQNYLVKERLIVREYYKSDVIKFMNVMYNVHNYLFSPFFSQTWTRACTAVDLTVKYKTIPTPILVRWCIL